MQRQRTLLKGKNVIEAKNIVKIFPGTAALKGVDFTLKRGEVKGLVGKNGAGKSTLVKILAGLERPTSGKIIFNGREVEIKSVQDSEDLGFRFVSQEPLLMEELTVAENIALREKYLKKVKLVNWKQITEECEKRIDESGFHLDPEKEVHFLTVSEKQMLLINREALSQDAEVIALDEATTSLSLNEREILFNLIRKQKEKGKSFIYISHEIEEIFKICDSVIVFRDGKVVLTGDSKDLTHEDLSTAIVGKEVKKLRYEKPTELGKPVLEFQNVRNEKLNNVSFSLHKGEILGIYGLRGSGRSELLRTTFGLLPVKDGRIQFQGKSIANLDSEKIIALGIGYMPEDRAKGLFYNRTGKENVTITALKRLLRGFLINLRMEHKLFLNVKDQLSIDMPTLEADAYYLSGGNKQKIMMGRSLATDAEVILLDESTKGIDVGVKYEIYRILKDLSKEGKSIIFTSSDLEEIMYISDRIMVLYNGQISGILSGKDIKKVNLVNYADGRHNKNQ